MSHTFVHLQFEGSSLRQLVSKICRGRYNPLPTRYSYELRLLVTQLFKVNPRDRPSVSSVLRRPFLEKLICKHLDPQVMQEEFSHTVLHRHRAAASQVSKGRTVNTAEKIQKSRAAERAAVAVKKLPAKPEWRVPLRAYSPAHFRPLHQRAAADREIHRLNEQQPRCHYQQYHAQLDALQRRKREDVLPPPLPPPPPHLEREREPHEVPSVEPYQIVAAARNEYLQRRHEANQYKLRAEKQLGLRPCTAESNRRPEGQEQEERSPEHQPAAQERRPDGQQEYLRQLDLIRQQYHQEMRQMRQRAEAEAQPQHKHETFVVDKPRDPEPSADSREQPRVSPAQDVEAALKQIREENRDQRRALEKKHRDKKGIMFEIRLDEEGMKKDAEEEKEEMKKEEEEEEEEEVSSNSPSLLHTSSSSLSVSLTLSPSPLTGSRPSEPDSDLPAGRGHEAQGLVRGGEKGVEPKDSSDSAGGTLQHGRLLCRQHGRRRTRRGGGRSQGVG
uniref:non-specific serine/threonine protein kinase n=1 Tax=Labrus bergylta TaxID=56723 RepID=A0A3Q3N7Y1_9LABR